MTGMSKRIWSENQSERPPRVLFLGMRSNFSRPSLQALLAAGVEVCAVVMPAPEDREELPALRRMEPPSRKRKHLPVNQAGLHASLPQMAWERNIPLWEVSRLGDPLVSELFSSYKPDLICVACFSRYIPRAILSIPRVGSLNVHPSLLPDNRGPEPLFWTFRLGHERSGVTIHLMDEGLDTGDIVAQEAIKLPDGITYAELERQTAELGGELLVKAVRDLVRGQAECRPQDESQSHYYPYPSNQQGHEDFVIHPEQWDARHVYNFIRGVKDWGEPLELMADAELRLSVVDALVYSYKVNDLRLLTGERNAWPVRCKRGKVVVKGRPV